MEPLHWPDFYPAESAKPESIWEKLPLVGWWFSPSDFKPVIDNINEQLLARPKPDITVWGNDLTRQKMAQYICSTIKTEYGWPNDHFIPNDPVEIVFQFPWDDLELVEFVMRVEEYLKIEIKDEEAETWDGVLAGIVDFLIDKQEQKAT